MRRVPLLAGSRVAVTTLDDDAVLLVPPPPLEPLVDVEGAVLESLRYPLGGPSLETLGGRRGRATIVVEPPLLPLPGALADPRRDALAAVVDALEQAGYPPERQTVLVAGGLERRAGRAQLELLLRPGRARDFRGALAVHDCEGALVPLGEAEGVALACHPALVDCDLAVTVTAAETVLHGGPAALLGACGAGAIRAAQVESLLELRSSAGWRLATAVEAEVARRVPVIGVSLLLDLPRADGAFRGYPHDAHARDALARTPLRRLFNGLPDTARRRVFQRGARELSAVAVLAGRPSVAHAEALVRAHALRGIAVEGPLDTILVPLPWKGVHQPREPLHALTAATVGLGLAMRLWRGRPPLVEGGTIVLLHPLTGTIGGGSQAPYLPLFNALRDGQAGARIRKLEAAASRDRRALDEYRAGRAPHPRLPFADWEGCGPALAHAGRVIVAGCRDAAAARALGLVPSHNLATALEMSHGVAGGRERLGVLLAPPYAPLVTGDLPGRA